MPKLLLKLSPLLFFLLIFSCAKDNDFPTSKEDAGTTETLEGTDDGRHCDIPCKKPDFLHVSQITGCSAVIDWGFEVPICGTFVVQLQNLATGTWTYYNSAVSPLTLSGLDACTKYTVGVSHVTNLCASIPLQVSFKTNCRKCEVECAIPCKQLDYLYTEDVTTAGGTIIFGHNTPTCGHFAAQLRNNVTGTYTYYDPVNSPWVLSGLEPCTSYTIGISHVTDLQACLPSQITFTTECEGPCEAEGLNAQAAYFDQFGFDVPGVIGLWDNYIGSSFLYPVEGYKNITDPILRLEANTAFTTMFCYVIGEDFKPADTYIKMWIDFNKNGEFESDELVVDYFLANDTGLCISNGQPENIPTEGICRVPARFMIGINNEITDPCEDVPLGQVIDFLVNIGDCSIDPLH